MKALTKLGFYKTTTGGGCMAYRRDTGRGFHILVTDEDQLPTEKTTEFIVGLYGSDDAQIEIATVDRDALPTTIAFFETIAGGDGVTGQRIKRLRAMTKEEAEREGWEIDGRHGAPTVIELENGMLLYPSRDEEGNDPGALFGYDPKTGKQFGVGG